MYTFDRTILISWNWVIFTWSWCMLCESHKLLDTCNLVPPPPFVELSLRFVVGLCSWPNDALVLLLVLLLLLLELFPCNFAADGMSQSFWFPEMPLNKKSKKIHIIESNGGGEGKITNSIDFSCFVSGGNFSFRVNDRVQRRRNIRRQTQGKQREMEREKKEKLN